MDAIGKVLEVLDVPMTLKEVKYHTKLPHNTVVSAISKLCVSNKIHRKGKINTTYIRMGAKRCTYDSLFSSQKLIYDNIVEMEDEGFVDITTSKIYNYYKGDCLTRTTIGKYCTQLTELGFLTRSSRTGKENSGFYYSTVR